MRFPLSFVTAKINTFSRIRPITLSKALLTEFLFYCIYEYASGTVRYVERKKHRDAVLDITLSYAWPCTNVIVTFGRSAPITCLRR